MIAKQRKKSNHCFIKTIMEAQFTWKLASKDTKNDQSEGSKIGESQDPLVLLPLGSPAIAKPPKLLIGRRHGWKRTKCTPSELREKLSAPAVSVDWLRTLCWPVRVDIGHQNEAAASFACTGCPLHIPTHSNNNYNNAIEHMWMWG